MSITTRSAGAAAKAVRGYAESGTPGAGVAAGAVLTLSCRKYALPVRWRGRRVRFLKPRFVGWQHSVEGVTEAVRITTKRRGQAHRVACVSAGPFAAAAQVAIATLPTDRRLPRRRFTVASLSVSALMVQALWLRSRAGDRFWILEPSHVAAVRGQPLTPRQFEASLRRVFSALAADIATVDLRLSDSAAQD